MIIFWLLAALMLLLALVVLLRPLLMTPRAQPENDDSRLAVYRAALAEVDQDLVSGLLSAEEAAAVRVELERELLHAIPVAETPRSVGKHPSKRTAVLLLLLLPAVVISLYLHLGRPSLITAPPGTQLDRATLEDMARRIEAQLSRSPDDPVGLRLLAGTYAALGRYDESAEALERVLVQQPEDAEVMIELAQALAGAAAGSYLGRPRELLERAVGLAPDHRMGLWLAGGAAMESGDGAAALHHWEELLPLVDDPAAAEAVRSLITRVRAETVAAATPAVPAPVGNPAEGSAPFQIRIRVELAPEFAEEAVADSVLFVSARSSDGPPMPLAAVRLPASGLPREVTLDQSTLLIPGTQTAELSKLDVTARISKSGQAERQSGDLIGEAGGVSPSAETPVRLLIDGRVP